MLKWSRVLGFSFLGLAATGYYQYQNNHSFRSVCNLLYAGTNMAYIYKYSDRDIHTKNEQASTYLRDALRNNGGIYLKLGQLIATLDVIVPDQYRNIMTSLTRQCEESTFQDVKKTVEEDLGYPLDVVFSQFSERPISSASIGQVHKARLLNGQEVAVKVQHRHLMGHVESDLAMMWTFTRAAKFLFREFHYEWLVEGFDKNIRIELDFNNEAANMKRTQYFLSENNFKDIYVPKVLLKPSKRVLVMEYIHGIHLDEKDNMLRHGINTKKIGALFSQMIIKMIHKQGFVHADTHSGNLMARKFKGRDQLVVLDHGLYQELDPLLLRNYNKFWLGLILNDPQHYEQAGRQLGTTNPKLLRSMLTSKGDEEFQVAGRSLFDLNPSKDRAEIARKAGDNHEKIIKVLEEMRREILLLLKVNEFARSIENTLGGREMGVYQDIANECVQNLGFSWWRRLVYYSRMLFARS